jgi:hypothetical protein
MIDPDRIEKAIDRSVTASIELADPGDAAIRLKVLNDAFEAAKSMSSGKAFLPAFLRGEPGMCYQVILRGLHWRIDPTYVADNCFVMKTKGGDDRVGYTAALFNAIIGKAKHITGQLRCRYEGKQEDGSLKCIVYATPKGETEPLEYETPTLDTIIKHLGRNEQGKVKGSPLYDLDPKQQLFYYGSKNFIRKWYSHILGGSYDREDIEGIEDMKDVTPVAASAQQSLIDRLKAAKQSTVQASRGFDPAHIQREVRENGHDETKDPSAGGGRPEVRSETGDTGGRDQRGAHEPSGDGGSDRAADQADGPAAGDGGQQAEAQGELIPPGEQPQSKGKRPKRGGEE